MVLKYNEAKKEYLCLFVKEEFKDQVAYEDDSKQCLNLNVIVDDGRSVFGQVKQFGWEGKTYYEYVYVQYPEVSKIYAKDLSNISANQLNFIKDTLVTDNTQ